MKKLSLWIFAGLVALAFPAWAQDSREAAGLLLTQSASVRDGAMGGVHTAIPADEAGAASGNPAALGTDPRSDVSAVYYRGIVDDAFGAVHGHWPLSPAVSIGGGVMIYDGGRFEWTTQTGETAWLSAQRDVQGVLTGCYHFGGPKTGIDAGANLKILHSTLLEEYSATAVAADFGVRAGLPGVFRNWHAGMAVKNIGTPLRYIEAADALPASMIFGLACDLGSSRAWELLLAGDVRYDLDITWSGNVGVEVRPNRILALRAGYTSASDLSAFSVGAGIFLNQLQLDYAFRPSKAMNAMHLASVTYSFEALPPSKAQASAHQETESEIVIPEHVEAKSVSQIEKIQAQLVEIRKAGGRPSQVIMNQGANQNVKVGYQGVLADLSGRTVAAIIIRQVDSNISLADIIGLSRNIDANVIAIIEKPVETSQAGEGGGQ